MIRIFLNASSSKSIIPVLELLSYFIIELILCCTFNHNYNFLVLHVLQCRVIYLSAEYLFRDGFQFVAGWVSQLYYTFTFESKRICTCYKPQTPKDTIKEQTDRSSSPQASFSSIHEVRQFQKLHSPRHYTCYLLQQFPRSLQPQHDLDPKLSTSLKD